MPSEVLKKIVPLLEKPKNYFSETGITMFFDFLLKKWNSSMVNYQYDFWLIFLLFNEWTNCFDLKYDISANTQGQSIDNVAYCS